MFVCNLGAKQVDSGQALDSVGEAFCRNREAFNLNKRRNSGLIEPLPILQG